MGKSSKATKKFQAKHLKKTLDHRKEVKKHKQLLAKHKKGKGISYNKSGSEGQVATKQSESEKEKENPFNVETDSEDEKEDYGVIDKKGKKSIDAEEKEEEEDDDIFDELDEMANDNVDEDYGEMDEEMGNDLQEEKPSKAKKNKKEADEFDGEENEDGKIEVTMELVKKWESQLEEGPSLKLIRNITQAFKAAVNVNENTEATISSVYKYFVTREIVFNKLLFLTLKKLPVAIQKLFPLKTKFNKENNIQVRVIKAEGSNKIKQLSAVLKQHAFTLITLLSDITRSNLNLKFILLTLSSIYDIFPYLLSFRTLMKKLLASMVNLWSSLILTSNKNKDEEGEEESKVNIDSFLDINVLAFSVILNLSKEYSSNILETIINLSYESFLKRSLTLPSSISLDSSETDLVTHKKFRLIEFLKTGLSSLFNIDVNLSYQVAFKYIRKLSIHLRNFLKNNSNIKSENDNTKNLKLIYNWQFVQSVDFWITFLADACAAATANNKKISLQELVYPAVQIAIGTMKLNSNPIYFPLKFYLLKSLTSLSESTSTYVPLLNIYIEMLNSSIFNKNFTTKKDKKSAATIIQSGAYMNTQGIKVSKSSVHTSEYQLYLINNFLNSLQSYLMVYVNSLAFPEFSFIIAKRLKQFTKKQSSSSTHKKNKFMIYFVKETNNLVSKINENGKFISVNRSQLKSFDPIQQTKLTSVEVTELPLYKFLMAKQEILDSSRKLHSDLLVNEQLNENSGSNDRKKIQENASEEYFKSTKKHKGSKARKHEEEDVEMSSDDDQSSSTGSI
ncbi:mRNA-binding ribosome synthesis protein [Saccharomycopsis crataegensis]|uniref:mRNA-binding ribosome synthesis protein n=1 Tax=Saccharomycopsis crataegensis TaxID=43959 RepID=A0AAV5QDR5_9ASCO|nr:mRNA-binding ribosome synthesis protein [Saccharomycopsis crataegensis]